MIHTYPLEQFFHSEVVTEYTVYGWVEHLPFVKLGTEVLGGGKHLVNSNRANLKKSISLMKKMAIQDSKDLGKLEKDKAEINELFDIQLIESI